MIVWDVLALREQVMAKQPAVAKEPEGGQTWLPPQDAAREGGGGVA